MLLLDAGCYWMLLDATGCYWMLLAACWMVWHGRCAAHSLYGQRKPKCIICWSGGLGSRAFQLCVFLTQNDRGLRAVCGLKWPCEKGLNCESSKNLRGPGVELRASAGVIAPGVDERRPPRRGRRPPRRGRRRATPEALASTGVDEPRSPRRGRRRAPRRAGAIAIARARPGEFTPRAEEMR